MVDDNKKTSQSFADLMSSTKRLRTDKITPYRKKIPPIAKQTQADELRVCLLYTSPSPRDQRGSRMPSSA